MVCAVERRAKERRRPHFSSIGVSDKTSTEREAKQHNLDCGGGDAHGDQIHNERDKEDEQNLDFKDSATTFETR